MILPFSWYAIKDIARLDTPALVVYPAGVRKNIQLAVGMAGGPGRLRPHVKTHKSPDATRLLMEAGIRQFKCATIAEAEMLAIAGADDVLLAYQPIGPKINRLVELIKKYPATVFSCLIDSPKAAAAMASVFVSAGLTVPVFIDIDTGMNRTGIPVSKECSELFKNALETPGITPVGLHAYDGHIRDTNIDERMQKCNDAFKWVASMRKVVERMPGALPITVVAGGSPTFPIHCLRPDVQCSPGTFIYWDKGSNDDCSEQGFSPAALVITRVISQHGTRITLDLGHKSIAAENPLDRRVHFLNSPIRAAGKKNPPQFISQSEEHLVLDAGAGHGFQVGDVLYGVPYHICPTVALYERAYTVEDGVVTGEWKNSARDRSIGV